MHPLGVYSLIWFSLTAITSVAAEPTDSDFRVLIVVGPSDHPPGTHEVAAGGRLLKYCLENASNLDNISVDLRYQWPQEQAVLDNASTIILLGDTFPLQRLPDTEANLAALGTMMDRGCGIVCVHYATGLRNEDVRRDGEHPLLHWMGGYFATKCEHHQSIAKIYPAAAIVPSAPEHPAWRGCGEFTLNDEPYINNYFGKDGNQLSEHVVALATSMLPPESPRKEIVAWCTERPDGGRGLGIVMPHFFRNWKSEDLRRLILNGIVWSGGREVPQAGVQTKLPNLAVFEPAALEPQPKPQPKKPVPKPAS